MGFSLKRLRNITICMMRGSLIAHSIIEQFSLSIVILHAGTIYAIQALEKTR